MGCNSCTSNAKRATRVTTKNVATKDEKSKKKSKPKPATKFMHVKVSGANMKRAFNRVQARAQAQAQKKKRKSKQI